MPVPPGCPQRTTGSPTFPEYTKLKVKIKLYTQSGSTMVEIPGGMFELGPIDVNSCSQIVDIPYSSLQAGWANPVVLGVADVRSDFECMFFGEGGTTPRCPAEKQVTSKTCWNVILQVATDATDNFL